MSDQAPQDREALAPWIAKMLTPAKLRRWDDSRHKAYEHILALQASAHPAIINMPTLEIYFRRIRQGQD